MTPPVNVVWLSLVDGIDSRGPWDTGLLEAMFADQLWPTGYTFDHHVVSEVPRWLDRAVVIVPARHHATAELVAQLNDELATLDEVVVVLVGDEEGIFPRPRLKHPKMFVWLQMPRPELDRWRPGWRHFGNGWPTGTLEMLATQRAETTAGLHPWVFVGQVTHPRRQQAANAAARFRGELAKGLLVQTAGFGRGLPRDEYLATLQESKVALCPSGPHTPDTFRVYEALEAGAVPLVDATSPRGDVGYWEVLTGSPAPLPMAEDWSSVGGQVQSLVDSWPRSANQAGAWWSQVKSRFVIEFVGDLQASGFGPGLPPTTTAIITSSPSRVHPSTTHIDAVIDSIPGWMPVIVAFDGTREGDDAAAYHEYVRRVIADRQGQGRFAFHVAQRHVHQVGLYRAVMPLVATPLILALEHDTPISEEEGRVDWAAATAPLCAGRLDVLRFHHEHEVHREHRHLMVDHVTDMMDQLPLRRTRQWSQRPHLARAAYYRAVLADEFSDEANCFIEDRMHSACQGWPWERNRLAIYHPDGNIRRSIHLDGRGDAPKHEDRQVF